MVTKLTDLFEPIGVDKAAAAAPPKVTPQASGGGGSAKLPAAPAVRAPAAGPSFLPPVSGGSALTGGNASSVTQVPGGVNPASFSTTYQGEIPPHLRTPGTSVRSTGTVNPDGTTSNVVRHVDNEGPSAYDFLPPGHADLANRNMVGTMGNTPATIQGAPGAAVPTAARVGTRTIEHQLEGGGTGLQIEEVPGGGTTTTEHPLEGGGIGIQEEEVTPDQSVAATPDATSEWERIHRNEGFEFNPEGRGRSLGPGKAREIQRKRWRTQQMQKYRQQFPESATGPYQQSSDGTRIGTRTTEVPLEGGGTGIQEEEVIGGGFTTTEHPGGGIQVDQVTPDQGTPDQQLSTDPDPPAPPLPSDQPIADQPPHEEGTMGPENPVNQTSPEPMLPSDQSGAEPEATPPGQEGGMPPTDPNEARFGVYPEGHPSAGSPIGPLLNRGDVAGMINGDTEINWDRIANSTRGEHELQIVDDLDRQYTDALAKGQGGGQLSPEDLETLARNRMMKTAIRTSKNPQETIKKHMQDGVYTRAELKEIIADDEEAQRQLAAYGDGAATEPGEEEKPSGLAQWFGDMEPDQRLAMMIGIPLALIGLIGSMTEGGIGNMLTGLLGVGSLAYGMSPGVRGMVQGLPGMLGGLFGGKEKSDEVPEGWGAVPEDDAAGEVSGAGAAPGTRTGVPMPTPDDNVIITDENGNQMSVHPSDPRAQRQDMFDPDGTFADPAIGDGTAAPGPGGPPIAGGDPAAPGQPEGEPAAAAPVRHTPKSIWKDSDISKEEVELVMNDENLRRQVLFSTNAVQMLRSAVAKGGPFAANIKRLKHVDAGLDPRGAEWVVRPYKIEVLTARKGSKVKIPGQKEPSIGQGMHPHDANKLYELAQQL